MAENEGSRVEEFQLKGEEVVAKVKELIHEGNVRRIIVDDSDGKTLLEIPLTVGVVGAVLLPPLAALGAIAAVLTDCTIRVIRQEPEEAEAD